METILVVEDEISVRSGIIDLLSNSGYSVLSASNGNQAIDILKTKTPDLIISDIMMPEVDGYQLMEKISQNDSGYIPFIYLTAKADYNDIRTGMNKGADDYIIKPFRAKDLLSAVKIRIEKSKKRNLIIDEIASNISFYIPHELRTPLVSIIGFTQMLLTEFDSYKQNEIIEMLKLVEESGLRLYNRIEKFIIFSEITVKTEKDNIFQEKTYPVSEIFNNVFGKFDSANINTLQIDETYLKINKEYFKFCISELIENALKFSEFGEKINIEAAIADGFYNLTVTNKSKIDFPVKNGNDIVPFVQHGREKIQQQGNGLGLAIVKKIMSLCHGIIKIECSIERNVKIVLSFPIIS